MTGIRWSAVLVLPFLVAGCAIPYAMPGEGGDSAGAREFGFIPQVDATARTISFDPAEWLTGQDAIDAAVADGKGQPGEPVPNDYYIRNPERRVLVLHVPPDARIRGAVPVSLLRMPPPCRGCRSFPVGVDEFFAAFTGPNRAGQGKYWVTIVDGRVAAVEEQYVP